MWITRPPPLLRAKTNRGRDARMKVRPNFTLLRRLAAFGALAVLGASLSACNDPHNMANARAWKPIPSDTLALMANKGTDAHEPVLIRTYKKEAEFEIWKRRKADGKYTLLKTYPMCRWSGQLGPKVREGDRQVPEGFYAISPGQMNPNSNYYLSFNVGYPNAYDRALGRTGGMIMVHGDCSSAGCFSMTDNQIAEIYAIAREGFGGGQREIQLQPIVERRDMRHDTVPLPIGSPLGIDQKFADPIGSLAPWMQRTQSILQHNKVRLGK